MVALCIAVLTGCFSNSEKAQESSNTEISSQDTTEHSGSIPDTLDNKNDNGVETEQSGEELELDYNVYADAMYSLVTESLIELENIEDPDKLMEEFSDMQQNVPAMEDILSSETYYYYINGKRVCQAIISAFRIFFHLHRYLNDPAGSEPLSSEGYEGFSIINGGDAAGCLHFHFRR